MTRELPFGLRVPVLHVIHPLHGDAGLVERVRNAGGLGIVDRFAAAERGVQAPAGVPHGIRTCLDELGRLNPVDGVRLAVVPLEEADRVSTLAPGELSHAAARRVEVGSARQAVSAEAARRAIARGPKDRAEERNRRSKLLQEALC
jgi:hypothetical protein